MRWDEVLRRLPLGIVTGVEVGVWAGKMSAQLLSNPDLALYMVDTWCVPDKKSSFYRSGDFTAQTSQEKFDALQRRAEVVTEFARNRATILKGESSKIAETFDDNIVDFVFIDADHSYEGCSGDIARWWPKVKRGGILSGHDYNTPHARTQGVDKAVDEFVKRTGLPIEFGDDWTWFIRKE